MGDKETDLETIAEENRNANDLPADDVEPSRETADEPAATETKDDGGEKGEPEKKKIEQGSKFADKREKIYQKYRESREPGDGEEEFAPVPSDREKVFFGKNTETRADREARRAEEREKADNPDGGETDPDTPSDTRAAPETGNEPDPDKPTQTRRRLKVHGREVELSDEEVLSYAQKAIAADNILEQAKAVRSENMEILDRLRKAEANQQPQDQTAKPQPGQEPENQPDTAELDQIIDRIQVGDAKEAKEALQKYGELIENRILERIGNIDDHIAETTQQITDNNRRREETLETLKEFGKEYPEYNESVSLQTALAHEAASTMRNTMTEIGVRGETLDRLKQQHGFDDMQVVAFAYRQLQEKYDLPSHSDVLRTSANTLRDRFGTKPAATRREEPADTPSQQPGLDRTERKRAISPQPRRANAAPTAEVQERSRDEARKAAVRQMRMARRGRV